MIVTTVLEGTEVCSIATQSNSPCSQSFSICMKHRDQRILRKILDTYDTTIHMHKMIFVNICFPRQQLQSLFLVLSVFQLVSI